MSFRVRILNRLISRRIGQVAPGMGGGMDNDSTASAATPSVQKESGTTTSVPRKVQQNEGQYEAYAGGQV